MILSGQLSREDALQELEKSLYDERELKDDFAYIAKKLQITVDELTDLIAAPGVDATTFKNWDGIYNKLKSAQRFVENLLGKGIKNYS
jgi:energy-converting hydrogenase A subunit M